MTLFKIENSEEPYGYPDTWHDIKAAHFLRYVREIASTFPREADELHEVNATLRAIESDLKRYESKWNMTRYQIHDWVKIGEAPKKVAAYFPEIWQDYVKATDRANELNALMSASWYANTYLTYVAKTVAHFTGVPYEKCIGNADDFMTLDSLLFLYDKISGLIKSTPADDKKREYTVAGIKYLLPEELMRKSTLIEFAEAAQFEEAMADLKNANYYALMDIAAVLLRPEGVPYSEVEYEKNKPIFEENLSMYDLFQIGFFLGELSRRYADAFQNYMLAAAMREASN